MRVVSLATRVVKVIYKGMEVSRVEEPRVKVVGVGDTGVVQASKLEGRRTSRDWNNWGLPGRSPTPANMCAARWFLDLQQKNTVFSFFKVRQIGSGQVCGTAQRIVFSIAEQRRRRQRRS